MKNKFIYILPIDHFDSLPPPETDKLTKVSLHIKSDHTATELTEESMVSSPTPKKQRQSGIGEFFPSGVPGVNLSPRSAGK